MKQKSSDLDILYILRSDRDTRRRVVLTLHGTQNLFYQGEEIQDIDMRLWGLTKYQRDRIDNFLQTGDVGC